MLELLISCSVLFVLSYLFYNFVSSKYPKNYPPGPIGIPILGNLLSIPPSPHLAFQRLTKIYGPIFSMRLGQERAVILHGSHLVKEAFADPRLSGRPFLEAFNTFIAGGPVGIGLSNGPASMEKRRFVLRQLKEFGGQMGMEGLIMDEVNELMEWIRSQNRSPVSLRRRFNLAVINALWRILCGNRFEHDDPKLVAILEEFERTLKGVFGGKLKSLLILFYPKIAKMFPNWSGWNFLLKSIEPRYAMFKAVVEEHKRNLTDGEPLNYIDAYLQESKSITDPNSFFHKTFLEKGIQADMADFFAAGSDTTATTLTWGVLRLMHHGDIQDRIRAEIDNVVGHSRSPSLADRNNLPHTEAFILELLRHTSVLGVSIAHLATSDVEFHGYIIPKGTSVYGNIYSSHHDEEVWGDPPNFRPSRFLIPDGTKVQRNEALIPFSTGRRNCIGETLARDELFLFISNMVQQFVIEAEEDKLKPTLEVHLGQLPLQPYPFKVVMKNRL